MKRNFNIDKDYLYSIFDMLKEYQDNEDVLIDKYRLERVINRYENNFWEETIEPNLMELIDDDLKKFEMFKPFYPFAKEFANTGLDSSTFLFETNYATLDITDEEAFSVIGDFFKNQEYFFSSGFNEFDEEAEDHLEFINKDSNTDGEMVYLKTTGDAFVFCPNYSNFTKMTILAHELEHVIDSFKNSDFYENLLIRETSAIFMEMIAGDYIAQKYQLIDDHFQRKLILHIILKDHASIFIDKMDMLEIISDNKYVADEILFNILDEEGFFTDCINFLMEKTITEDFFYILSYLIAIELYFIYYSDKQRALNILEDIIMNGTDDNILDLLIKHEIVLNKSVKKYEHRLLKGIKKTHD